MIGCEVGEFRSPSIRLKQTPRTGLGQTKVKRQTIYQMNKLELSIQSKLDNIPQVENFIEKLMEQYRLSPKIYGNIALSIVEAVHNAILYGNKQNPQKKVMLTAVQNTQEVIITVEDEGEGFDFNHIPEPTIPEKFREESGRGLYLIGKLTDKLIFDKNGAKVIMIFTFNQAKQ